MTTQVNVQHAKTHLSELLARVERGEHVVIARGGSPVAACVPVAGAPERELGFVAGGPVPESFFLPLPDDELDSWDGR